MVDEVYRVERRVVDLPEMPDLDDRHVAVVVVAEDDVVVHAEDDMAYHRKVGRCNTATDTGGTPVVVLAASVPQEASETVPAHVLRTIPVAVHCVAEGAVGTDEKEDNPHTPDDVVEEAYWSVLEVRKDTHVQAFRHRVPWKDAEVACAVVAALVAAADS